MTTMPDQTNHTRRFATDFSIAGKDHELNLRLTRLTDASCLIERWFSGPQTSTANDGTPTITRIALLSTEIDHLLQFIRQTEPTDRASDPTLTNTTDTSAP